MKKQSENAMVAAGLAAATLAAPVAAGADVCSVWLVENSRFMGVPFGAFHARPRIRAGQHQPAQQHQHRRPAGQRRRHQVRQRTDAVRRRLEPDRVPQDDGYRSLVAAVQADRAARLRRQGRQARSSLATATGIMPVRLDEFPNAVLYIQKEELRGIEWALNYPHQRISAVNDSPGGCARTPACGYPPKTMDSIYGKVLRGKAVIVDGEMEVMPGREDPSGVPRPYRRLAVAGSPDRDRQAGVRQRCLLVLGRRSATGKSPTRSRPTRCSSSWPTRSATRSPAAIRTASARHEPLSY